MVGMGMMGMLALGMSQMTNQTQRSQMATMSALDYNDFVTELSLMLANPADCKASLATTSFLGSVLGNPATPMDVEIYSGDANGNRVRKQFSGTDPVKREVGMLQLQSMQFGIPNHTGGNFPPGVNQSFVGNLRIRGVRRFGGGAPARPFREINKSVKITFDTNGAGVSTITGCSSAAVVNIDFNNPPSAIYRLCSRDPQDCNKFFGGTMPGGVFGTGGSDCTASLFPHPPPLGWGCRETTSNKTFCMLTGTHNEKAGQCWLQRTGGVWLLRAERQSGGSFGAACEMSCWD